MVLPKHQPLRCSQSRTGIEPGMCPQPPKQAKLQVALEVVRKDMQETLAQETTLGKKIIIWKVSEHMPSGHQEAMGSHSWEQ